MTTTTYVFIEKYKNIKQILPVSCYLQLCRITRQIPIRDWQQLVLIVEWSFREVLIGEFYCTRLVYQIEDSWH